MRIAGILLLRDTEGLAGVALPGPEQVFALHLKKAVANFGVRIVSEGPHTKVTLRVVPTKRLHYRGYRKKLSDCLANLEQYKQENSHFEFFWFP